MLPRKAWTPQNHAGLTFWLDASDLGSLTLVAGAVASWRDKGPYGRHFTEATNRPAWAANAATGANGQPLAGVTFDGTNDILTQASAWMYAAGAAAFFLVSTSPAAATTRYILSEGSTSSATPVYAPFRSDATTASSVRSQITSDAGTNILNSAPAGLSGFVTTTTLLARLDDGANMTARLNGQNGNTTAYTRAATTLNVACLGARAKATPDSFAPITIHELCAIDHDPSQWEYRQFEGAMARKWGEIALLAAHAWAIPGNVP